jgi:hypothetical protein
MFIRRVDQLVRELVSLISSLSIYETVCVSRLLVLKRFTRKVAWQLGDYTVQSIVNLWLILGSHLSL